MFSKYIAEAMFSFPNVLHVAFGALYHVYQVRRRAGDVMPYIFLLVSSEESVRRGSLYNKTAHFTPFLCDGFLYCASVFFKSIAEVTFSFPYVSDFADFVVSL